jgi:auxin efflux carrier family protein
LFPLGGSRLIAWDWLGPDVEDDDVREIIRRRRQAILKCWLWIPRRLRKDAEPTGTIEAKRPGDLEKEANPHSKAIDTHLADDSCLREDVHFVTELHDGMPHLHSRTATDIIMSPITSAAPTVVHEDDNEDGERHDVSVSKTVRFSEEPSSSPSVHSRHHRHRLTEVLKSCFIQMCSPPSISIIVSFAISLINPVKALFIHVPGTHIPDAPDGQPPLAFVMDTATFVGAASVPLGLICLGSALARLKVPMTLRGWRAMPVGAISALSVAKIVVNPVLGVLICQGLTHVGVIDKNDKVLRFVCLYVFVISISNYYRSSIHLDSSLVCQRRRLR